MPSAQPVIPADASLEEIQAYFVEERFATATLGAVVEEGRPGYGRVSVQLGPGHKNAMGNTMGGVYFTLGDFAFAVASCVGSPATVSVNCSIDYLRAAKGNTLTAECKLDKDGRSLVFAHVNITDAEGTLCARMTATGMRISR